MSHIFGLFVYTNKINENNNVFQFSFVDNYILLIHQDTIYILKKKKKNTQVILICFVRYNLFNDSPKISKCKHVVYINIMYKWQLVADVF